MDGFTAETAESPAPLAVPLWSPELRFLCALCGNFFARRAPGKKPAPAQANFFSSAAMVSRITWPTIAMLFALTLSRVSSVVCQ
jgi:hypothetical protein